MIRIIYPWRNCGTACRILMLMINCLCFPLHCGHRADTNDVFHILTPPPPHFQPYFEIQELQRATLDAQLQAEYGQRARDSSNINGLLVYNFKHGTPCPPPLIPDVFCTRRGSLSLSRSLSLSLALSLAHARSFSRTYSRTRALSHT